MILNKQRYLLRGYRFLSNNMNKEVMEKLGSTDFFCEKYWVSTWNKQEIIGWLQYFTKICVQWQPPCSGGKKTRIFFITEHEKSTAWIIFQIKAKTLRIQNIGDDTPTIGVLLWLFGPFPWQPWPLSYVNLQFTIKVCYDCCSKLLKNPGFFLFKCLYQIWKKQLEAIVNHF